jgi:hypothetical protein
VDTHDIKKEQFGSCGIGRRNSHTSYDKDLASILF